MPDPIYAAIETDRKLNAEFIRLPATPAGLAAYLDYLLKESIALGGDFYFDGKHETFDFLKSLHRAVHGMSGLRPMHVVPLRSDPDADLAALEIKIMAVAREAEISGSACNRAEAAFFAWRRKIQNQRARAMRALEREERREKDRLSL